MNLPPTEASAISGTSPLAGAPGETQLFAARRTMETRAAVRGQTFADAIGMKLAASRQQADAKAGIAGDLMGGRGIVPNGQSPTRNRFESRTSPGLAQQEAEAESQSERGSDLTPQLQMPFPPNRGDATAVTAEAHSNLAQAGEAFEPGKTAARFATAHRGYSTQSNSASASAQGPATRRRTNALASGPEETTKKHPLVSESDREAMSSKTALVAPIAEVQIAAATSPGATQNSPAVQISSPVMDAPRKEHMAGSATQIAQPTVQRPAIAEDTFETNSTAAARKPAASQPSAPGTNGTSRSEETGLELEQVDETGAGEKATPTSQSSAGSRIPTRNEAVSAVNGQGSVESGKRATAGLANTKEALQPRGLDAVQAAVASDSPATRWGAADSEVTKSGQTRRMIETEWNSPRQVKVHAAIEHPAASGIGEQGLVHEAMAGGAGRAAEGPEGEAAMVAVQSASNASAQETFAALDSNSSVGIPGWVHAGGQSAEAGFEDPALGWVGVRADVSGGSVHAVLMPGSAEAAQVLSAHLPGLGEYLGERHSPVSQLTVDAPGAGSPDTGAGQGMQENARQSAGENHAQGAQFAAAHGTETTPVVGELSDATANGAAEFAIGAAGWSGEERGARISVMA